MLKIIYTMERNTNARLSTKEWMVGEPIPTFVRSYLWGVQFVTVDGPEATHLGKMFSVIPWSNNAQTIWCEDMARFIVANFCTLE